MKKKRKLIGRMVQVVLRVQPEVDEEVREIARKEHRSYSSVLRQAISEWLENRKDRKKGRKK
jgi:predicted transcriptional regulator